MYSGLEFHKRAEKLSDFIVILPAIFIPESDRSDPLERDRIEDEVESWEKFRSGLRRQDYEVFDRMMEGLRDCRDAMKSKENMPSDALLMALILKQQKIINSLLERYQIENGPK